MIQRDETPEEAADREARTFHDEDLIAKIDQLSAEAAEREAHMTPEEKQTQMREALLRARDEA